MSLPDRLDAIAQALTDLEAGYTAYATADALVSELETDVAALDGAQAVPADLDTRVAELRARVDALDGGAVPPPDPGAGPVQWFAPTSLWNMPLGAVTVDPDRTTLLRSVDPWVNRDQYSHPINVAADGNPMVTVRDRDDASLTVEWPIRFDVTIAAGTDRHCHVVWGRRVLEMWTAEWVGDEMVCGRFHVVDLDGDGLGPQNGVRAYGGAATAGLIVGDDTSEINHRVAIALTDDQLYHQPDTWPGYDASGYGTALGYVWPATEQDYNSAWNYRGTIPMGSLVAIPADVDLAGLGLSPHGMVLASAFQRFGGIVTDRSGSMVLGYFDPNDERTKPMSDALVGPSWTASDLRAIRSVLAVVTED